MTEAALQGFCVAAVCRLTVVVISFAVCVHAQSMTDPGGNSRKR